MVSSRKIENMPPGRVKKIDEDTFEITSVVKKTVRLSELRRELAEKKLMNGRSRQIISWQETLPEDKKSYVLALPLLDETDTEDLITELEAL